MHSTSAIDSFINSKAGVLVLEWLKNDSWTLLSQSYFHYIPEENGYVLDNIERVKFEEGEQLFEQSGVTLAYAYAWLANYIKNKFTFLEFKIIFFKNFN